MLKSSIVQLIAVFVYLVILIVGIKKRFSLKKHITVLLFNIYVIGVVSITLFPIPVQGLPIVAPGVELFRNNFIPFGDIYSIIKTHDFSIIRYQIGGNLLLFVPLGYFIPIISKNMSTFFKVLLTGFICSIGIEGLQALISFLIHNTYRSTSVDDVLLNTVGVSIGYGLFILLAPIAKLILDYPTDS